MRTTADNLRRTARLLTNQGIHTGDQFASAYTGLDVCAAAYIAAEDALPTVFFTDEVASIDLIEASQPAMDVIKAISAALDSEACETDGQPDYIEHVSNWARTPGIREENPPTPVEVIGRILRAAEKADANPHAA